MGSASEEVLALEIEHIKEHQKDQDKRLDEMAADRKRLFVWGIMSLGSIVLLLGGALLSILLPEGHGVGR